MISTIWIPALLSLAVFIFLAISGRETSNRQSISLSSAAYGLSFILAILAFIGVLRLGPQTYLLSFFHTTVHEGFSVNVTTGVLFVILYGVLLGISLTEMRVDARRQGQLDTYRYWSALHRSWFAFGLTVILLSPTLSQGLVGLSIIGLGSLVRLAQMMRTETIELRVISGVCLLIGVILQTVPTWVVWSMLHTVQLTVVQHEGPGGSKWIAPTWVVWVWFIGMVLQGTAFLILILSRRRKGQRTIAEDGDSQPTVTADEAQRNGDDGLSVPARGGQLRLTMPIALGSGAYIWLAWSVVVVAPWMITLVAIAFAFAAAIVILPFVTRKPMSRPESGD